jgi:hypothetical protein
MNPALSPPAVSTTTRSGVTIRVRRSEERER